jgi:hypothetical protein
MLLPAGLQCLDALGYKEALEPHTFVATRLSTGLEHVLAFANALAEGAERGPFRVDPYVYAQHCPEPTFDNGFSQREDCLIVCYEPSRESEGLHQGGQAMIRWKQHGRMQNRPVRLCLVRQDALDDSQPLPGFEIEIASSLANTRSFVWDIPADLEPGDGYRILITELGGRTTMSLHAGPFSILPAAAASPEIYRGETIIRTCADFESIAAYRRYVRSRLTTLHERAHADGSPVRVVLRASGTRYAANFSGVSPQPGMQGLFAGWTRFAPEMRVLWSGPHGEFEYPVHWEDIDVISGRPSYVPEQASGLTGVLLGSSVGASHDLLGSTTVEPTPTAASAVNHGRSAGLGTPPSPAPALLASPVSTGPVLEPGTPKRSAASQLAAKAALARLGKSSPPVPLPAQQNGTEGTATAPRAHPVALKNNVATQPGETVTRNTHVSTTTTALPALGPATGVPSVDSSAAATSHSPHLPPLVAKNAKAGSLSRAVSTAGSASGTPHDVDEGLRSLPGPPAGTTLTQNAYVGQFPAASSSQFEPQAPVVPIARIAMNSPASPALAPAGDERDEILLMANLKPETVTLEHASVQAYGKSGADAGQGQFLDAKVVTESGGETLADFAGAETQRDPEAGAEPEPTEREREDTRRKHKSGRKHRLRRRSRSPEGRHGHGVEGTGEQDAQAHPVHEMPSAGHFEMWGPNTWPSWPGVAGPGQPLLPPHGLAGVAGQYAGQYAMPMWLPSHAHVHSLPPDMRVFAPSLVVGFANEPHTVSQPPHVRTPAAVHPHLSAALGLAAPGPAFRELGLPSSGQTSSPAGCFSPEGNASSAPNPQATAPSQHANSADVVPFVEIVVAVELPGNLLSANGSCFAFLMPANATLAAVRAEVDSMWQCESAAVGLAGRHFCFLRGISQGASVMPSPTASGGVLPRHDACSHVSQPLLTSPASTGSLARSSSDGGRWYAPIAHSQESRYRLHRFPAVVMADGVAATELRVRVCPEHCPWR